MVNTGRRVFEKALEHYRLHGAGRDAMDVWMAAEFDAEEDARWAELNLMVTEDRFHHPNG
jgi:hypothetical protein